MPSGTLTIVDTLTLEGDEEFVRIADVPDTPDAFGGADAINFTGAAPVMFTSDGSLIDRRGDVTNGTIFVANPDQPGDGACRSRLPASPAWCGRGNGEVRNGCSKPRAGGRRALRTSAASR